MIQATTGADHRAAFAYANKEEAEALIAASGGLAALVTSVLGASKPPAWAKRGDLVLANLDEGPTVGVCIGHQFLSVGARGLMVNPISLAIEAWTV